MSEFWPAELPPCDESTLLVNFSRAAYLHLSRLTSPRIGSLKSWFLRMKPLVDTGSLSDRGLTLAFVYGPIQAKQLRIISLGMMLQIVFTYNREIGLKVRQFVTSVFFVGLFQFFFDIAELYIN